MTTPARGNLQPAPSYSSNFSDSTAVVDETGSLVPPQARLQTLPEGAMPNPFDRGVGGGQVSPPATPSQRLLDPEPSHVQYATYQDDEIKPWKNPDILVTDESQQDGKTYVPWPLRVWFWLPLVVAMAGGAITLEVLLYISNKNQGWATGTNDFTIGQTGIRHYLYTLPPVAVAAIVVAMWTWTDIEIKRLQPYVDLVHGDSPPQRSLLLDYTRTNNFLVWTHAYSNKHYLVALASIMVVLSLTFQPLASALLVVKDTWWTEPDMTVNNLGALGLNQNLQFNDLTSFLTAAGYAAASILYHLDQPPFVRDDYTVAPFELPTNIVANGTVFANTTALKTNPGCQYTQVQMTQQATGWRNSVSLNGCSLTWDVDHNATTLFGTDTPDCGGTTPPQFSPVVFWFFTYQPSALASATVCWPTISFWDVNVQINLANGSVTKITEVRPFTSQSNFSSLAGNVTGPPLNGRAYNGIKFNLTNPDKFVLARQAATQLQMPAAVFQSAVQSPEGLTASFTADRFVQLSTNVYRTYLELIAKTVYFLPFTQPITVQVRTVKKRVFLSGVIVHLLAAAMFVLAFCATIIHVFHRAERRNLRLRHEPGTIASAVSIGAQTGIGNLLAGRQDEKEMSHVMRDKRFRIDPQSMKIIMEGEEGYEYAASPMNRRRSIFAALQGQRSSKRFSQPPRTPNTPGSQTG